MKNKFLLTHALPLVSILLLSFFLACNTGAEENKAAAITAAENFLLLIDTGQYAQSWDVCSSLFQRQVKKEDWIRQISAVRPHLGSPVKRDIISAEYMTALPGAPDGEYIVIQYETSFTNKQKGVETVTPMLDKDGQWKVSGYYIR